ncbi:MAG: hypothetical protein KA243_02690 [Candidatus Aminicenantes bacterium]|nr:hypothetical protein [Candidatus Aminicenantes bacterium]NLH77599.1 hypothetical protein [Acidobacteriota bacterium]
MKKAFVLALTAAVLVPAAAAAAQADLGISVSDGRLRSFYIAVGDHYRVAPRDVVDFRTRHRLLDEELPVVYFMAARAHVGPQVVVDLRIGRRTWFDVAVRLGLSPEIFFLPVRAERIGPPYGNAYGYYRKHGRGGDWRTLVLSDREVVDLVNLRFLSEYHSMTPDDIIVLRGRQTSFIRIHDEIGRAKGKGGPAGPARNGGPGKGPAKAKKK